MAINKKKIVAQAQKYTTRGQFEKAIGEYQRLLKVEPNDIRTWLKVGDLYTRMGARKEATDTYLKVAEQYTKNGFHLKAIAVYKQVLKLDPTLVDIYQFLANSYLDLGLTSEALIQLEQLADMYQRTNHLEKLLFVLMKMGEIDPNNIATRLRIAEHLSKENRASEAVEHFSIACQELKKQGRIDDFLKVTERLLYHDSSRTDLALEAAAVYLEQRQYKHALAKLQTCFVKNPRDLNTLEMLANAFRGLEQPDKAVSVYKEMSLLLQGPHNEIKRREVLQTILELDPTNKTALKGLGLRGVSLQAPPESSTLQSEILPDSSSQPIPQSIAPRAAPPDTKLTEEEIDKKTAEIMSETEVLIKYGLTDRAVDHLQHIFELDPYHIDAREQFKDILLEADRISEAVEQLFFLAEAFRDTQPEGTIYYLHEILNIDSSNTRAREMIVELGGIMPEDLDDHAGEEIIEDESMLLEEDDVYILNGAEKEMSAPGQAPLSPLIQETATDSVSLDISIDDIPFVPQENILQEDDLLGPSEIATKNEITTEFDTAALSDTHPEQSVPYEPEDDEITFETPLESIVEEPLAEAPRVEVPRFTKPPARKPPVEAPRVEIPRFTKPPARKPPVKAPVERVYSDEDSTSIADALEEIDFFVEQDLLDEATATLEELMGRFPNHPQVLDSAAKLQKSQVSESPIRTPSLSVAPALMSDVGSIADSAITDSTSEDITSIIGADEVDRDSNKRRLGVKNEISADDFSTHYDLGLAYKEMSLFEDAIKEFEIASGDPENEAASRMMIGMCYTSLDRRKEAVKTFRGCLAIGNLSKQQELALLYELGVVYETMGHEQNALKCFKRIKSKDPGFADVSQRLKALASGGRVPSGKGVFSQ